MLLFYRFAFLVFLSCSPLFAFSQHSIYPPAVDILEGTVLDSATKKPVGKVWVKVSWGDSSRVIPCDGDGRLDIGDLFYHTTPDSIKITAASTAYRVTKYKVKTYQSTAVLDSTGKKTTGKWYLVIITVYVTKESEE